MAIIDSLEVALGFKADTTTLNQFIKGLGELNFQSILAATGLGGVVDGVNNLIKSTTDSLTPFNNLARIIGDSAGQLQKYDQAAQQFGYGQGEMLSQLQALSDASAQMVFGQGKGSIIAGMFGVDLTKYGDHPEQGAIALLRSIREKLKTESRTYVRAELLSAGLPENLLLLVDHIDELEKSFKNADSTFEKSGAILDKYKKALNSIKDAMNAFGVIVGTALLPVLQLLSTVFQFITKLLEYIGSIPLVGGILQWVAAFGTLWISIIGGIGLVRTLIELLRLAFGGAIVTAVTGAAVGGAATTGIAGGAGIAAAMNPELWPMLLAGLAGIGVAAGAGWLINKFSMKDQMTPGGNVNNYGAGDKIVNNTFNINGGDSSEVYRTSKQATSDALRDSDSLMGNGQLGY